MLRSILAVLATLLAASAAHAQGYPSRPVKIIVPFAAGGPADVYTLLMMSNTHTVNESLIHDKPFKLLRDFVPVAPVNSSDLVLVVHPSVPAIEKWARIVKISGAGRDR